MTPLIPMPITLALLALAIVILAAAILGILHLSNTISILIQEIQDARSQCDNLSDTDAP